VLALLVQQVRFYLIWEKSLKAVKALKVVISCVNFIPILTSLGKLKTIKTAFFILTSPNHDYAKLVKWGKNHWELDYEVLQFI